MKKTQPARESIFEGDYLLPGLIELHTDNLESHYVPRPAVKWHVGSAVLAYDAQIAAAGITTVFEFVPRRGRRIRDGRQARRRGRSDRRGSAQGGQGGLAARRPSHAPALRGPGAERRRGFDRASRHAFRPTHLAHGSHAGATSVPRSRQIFPLLLRQVGTVASRCRGNRQGAPEGGQRPRAAKPAAHRRDRQGARRHPRQPRRYDGARKSPSPIATAWRSPSSPPPWKRRRRRAPSAWRQ